MKLPDRFAHLQDHARHTPAGLSLHPRDKYKMAVWGNAGRIAPDPQRYTVDLHGASDRAEVNGQRLSAKDVADIIRSSGDWDGEQPIRLISCQTGTTKDGFAAQLARELGVDVVAPNKDAWVDDNGNIFASSAHNDPGALTRIHSPGWPPNGEWITFKPDGTSTRHNSSTPPGHVPTWGHDTPDKAPKSYRRNAGEPPWANDPHYLQNQQRQHGYGYHPPASPGESFGPRGSSTNQPQPMVYAGRDPQGNPIYRPAYVPPTPVQNPPSRPAPAQAHLQLHQNQQPRPSHGLPPGAVGRDLQGRPIDRQGRVLGPPMPVHQQMAPQQRHGMAPQQRRDVVHPQQQQQQHQRHRDFDAPPVRRDHDTQVRPSDQPNQVHHTPAHRSTQETPQAAAPRKDPATEAWETFRRDQALADWAHTHHVEPDVARRINAHKELGPDGTFPPPEPTESGKDPIQRPTHMTTKDMVERDQAMRAGHTKDTDYEGMQGYDFEPGTENLPAGLTLKTPDAFVAQRYPHLAGRTFTYNGQPVVWRKPQNLKERQSFRRDPLPGFNEDGSGDGLVAKGKDTTITEISGHIGGATGTPAKSATKSPEHAMSRKDGTIPRADSEAGRKLVEDGTVTVLPNGMRRMDVWISEIYDDYVIDVDATVRYYDGEKTSGHAEAEDLHLGVPAENIRRRWKQICVFDENGDLVDAHMANEPPVVNPRFKYAHLVQDDK